MEGDALFARSNDSGCGATDGVIEIPTLCHLRRCGTTGACRVCCVEVKGREIINGVLFDAGYSGMEVFAETELVHRSRKMIVELCLASGRHNCLMCEANGNCRLQDLAYFYKITKLQFPAKEEKDIYPTEDANPFIVRDFSRCILCGRCVQACNELVVNRAISQGYRGAESKIVTGGDNPYNESECVFCGQCVQACPVGALTEKKASGRPRMETEKVRTTCTYCGVGCQMWLHVKEGRITKVTGVEGAAPNDGRLCVKGRFGYDFIYSPERLTTPIIR